MWREISVFRTRLALMSFLIISQSTQAAVHTQIQISECSLAHAKISSVGLKCGSEKFVFLPFTEDRSCGQQLQWIPMERACKKKSAKTSIETS